MSEYEVEIGYRTRRGGVAVCMTVDAFDPDEAEEIASDKVLKGYPARKFAFCKVSQGSRRTMSVPLGEFGKLT